MPGGAVPKLLFIGAGNIAKSIIKGIIKARPDAAQSILATAPSNKNLHILNQELKCKVTLLDHADECISQFNPKYVFLCFKPQVFLKSIANPRGDSLTKLLTNIPKSCTTLSLLAGVERQNFVETFGMPSNNIVRVMLNTSAEIGSTSILYYAPEEFDSTRAKEMEDLFRLIGKAVVRLNDENLMDVATGVCGSGIAFFYEMIQTISDTGVKNGLSRSDATLVAAQLSKSAGEMLLEKQSHPLQLRDDVTSPAGTTIYGLSSWHENTTGQSISRAFQASIDRARNLTEGIKYKIKDLSKS